MNLGVFVKNLENLKLKKVHLAQFLSHAPGGTRTPNAQIRSLPLYPLSYGRMM